MNYKYASTSWLIAFVSSVSDRRYAETSPYSVNKRNFLKYIDISTNNIISKTQKMTFARTWNIPLKK